MFLNLTALKGFSKGRFLRYELQMLKIDCQSLWVVW